MVFFSKLDAIRGRRCGAGLARDEDGLVGRFPLCECGAHLAVGLVGDGEAMWGWLWCTFGVRRS